MIRYFKYNSEEYIDVAGAVDYLEIHASERLALRQLTVGSEDTIASNMRHPRWGLVLAEGEMDCEEIIGFPGVIEITQAEFEEQWQHNLARFAERWQQTKAHFPVGMAAEGVITIFYPQGVIVDLGEGALGCISWASSARIPRSTHVKLAATIAGYDEQQHWLILEHPQVEPEAL